MTGRTRSLPIVALLLLSACVCVPSDPHATAQPLVPDEAYTDKPQTAQPLETPTRDEAISHLLNIHTEAPAVCALPDPKAYTVRYFTGVSHSFHRIVVEGHSYGADSAKRPDGSFYHEFYYDKDGRLAFIIAHQTDGKRYVTDQIHYLRAGPYARLTYSAEGLSFGDYVYYADGKPFLACRVLGDRAALMEMMQE